MTKLKLLKRTYKTYGDCTHCCHLQDNDMFSSLSMNTDTNNLLQTWYLIQLCIHFIQICLHFFQTLYNEKLDKKCCNVVDYHVCPKPFDYSLKVQVQFWVYFSHWKCRIHLDLDVMHQDSWHYLKKVTWGYLNEKYNIKLMLVWLSLAIYILAWLSVKSICMKNKSYQIQAWFQEKVSSP